MTAAAINTKRCPHCELVMPIDRFFAGQSWCKACKAEDCARRRRREAAARAGVHITLPPRQDRIWRGQTGRVLAVVQIRPEGIDP